MSSAIRNLQNSIVAGNQSVTQLLRQAKLIASKLRLNDIEKWVDLELNGYSVESELPPYRYCTSSSIEVCHPFRKWEFAGHFQIDLPLHQRIAELEDLAQDQVFYTTLPQQQAVDNPIGARWPQRVVIPCSQLKKTISAITDELLRWTTELEKRGIIGEDMSFGEEEKQKAAGIIFNIGTLHGAAGNISNSSVTVNSEVKLYDFHSVQQLLIDRKISKEDRRELEDIMDELKIASPQQKPSLMKRAEKWIVKHKELLGVGVELVVKAIGSTGS